MGWACTFSDEVGVASFDCRVEGATLIVELRRQKSWRTLRKTFSSAEEAEREGEQMRAEYDDAEKRHADDLRTGAILRSALLLAPFERRTGYVAVERKPPTRGPQGVPDAWRLYTDATVGGRPVTVAPLAELNLKSGEIVVGDPTGAFMLVPLKRKVAPGRYPVSVALVDFGYAPDEKKDYTTPDGVVGSAMVRFAAAEPHAWERAEFEVSYPQTTIQTDEGPLPGYGVDGGTAAFMDRGAAEQMDEQVMETLVDQMLAQTNPGWQWTEVAFEQAGGGNVIAFSSGNGDGAYASYWGLSATGEPVCLMTDFEVIEA